METIRIDEVKRGDHFLGFADAGPWTAPDVVVGMWNDRDGHGVCLELRGTNLRWETSPRPAHDEVYVIRKEKK